MEKLLIATLLMCQPGHRLVDWSNRLPPGYLVTDFLVTIEPYYARLSIYRPGHFDAVQRCCNGRPASVLRVAIEDGRFCIAQSQPQMKWTLRLSLKSGLDL